MTLTQARVSGWARACGRKIAFNELNKAHCGRNYARFKDLLVLKLR